MSKWFLLNIILLGIAIRKFVTNGLFPAVPTHIMIGFLAVLFYLFNWTRHAVFSTIRDVPNRQTKIKYANLSKKVLPFHKWTGTTALLIALIHATIVIHTYGFQWQIAKFITGTLALIILAGIITTGWMRLYRPTIAKRMTHLYLGMALFWMILLHIWL